MTDDIQCLQLGRSTIQLTLAEYITYSALYTIFGGYLFWSVETWPKFFSFVALFALMDIIVVKLFQKWTARQRKSEGGAA